MKIHGLYAIVPADELPSQHFMSHCESVLLGGAAMMQYRSKRRAREAQIQQLVRLLALCREYRVPLIINDDLELAQELGASGVHLGRNDPPIAEARERLGPSAIIGATCHDSLDAARQAADAGASYVSFGCLFESRTKPDAKPCAPEIVAQAAAELTLPVIAIGGLTPDNAAEVIRAGADMVAVCGALFSAESPEIVARRFTALFTADRETTHGNV